MESFDQEKARRVWDRVNGNCHQEPDFDALNALMCQELTDAAVLLRLSKRIGGRGGDLLRMARHCRQHAGYLRGICSMVHRNCPQPAVPLPADGPPGAALRKCYVNSLHRMREYEKMIPDPEYGPVFRNMAQTMQHHCASLLELIGYAER